MRKRDSIRGKKNLNKSESKDKGVKKEQKSTVWRSDVINKMMDENSPFDDSSVLNNLVGNIRTSGIFSNDYKSFTNAIGIPMHPLLKPGPDESNPIGILNLGIENKSDDKKDSKENKDSSHIPFLQLNLRHHDIDSGTLGCMCLAMESSKPLIILKIYNASINEKGFEYLKNTMNKSNKIVSLSFDYNYLPKISNISLPYHELIVQHSFTLLTSLSLRGNNINDDDIILMANSLKGNLRLRMLNLYDNNITDIGAKELINSLKLNTTLTHLSLMNNPILGENDLLENIVELITYYPLTPELENERSSMIPKLKEWNRIITDHNKKTKKEEYVLNHSMNMEKVISKLLPIDGRKFTRHINYMNNNDNDNDNIENKDENIDVFDELVNTNILEKLEKVTNENNDDNDIDNKSQISYSSKNSKYSKNTKTSRSMKSLRSSKSIDSIQDIDDKKENEFDNKNELKSVVKGNSTLKQLDLRGTNINLDNIKYFLNDLHNFVLEEEKIEELKEMKSLDANESLGSFVSHGSDGTNSLSKREILFTLSENDLDEHIDELSDKISEWLIDIHFS